MLWSGFRLHGDPLSWDVIAMILTIPVIDYINVTHGPRSQYQSIIPGEKLRNNPLLKTLQRGWGGGGNRPQLPQEEDLGYYWTFRSQLWVHLSLPPNTRLKVVLLGEVPESDQSSISE